MSRFSNILNPFNWFKPKNPLSGVFVWSGTAGSSWENILNWGIGGIRPIPGLPPDTEGYGSNAERLPGENDNVLLLDGTLVGGSYAVKSLQTDNTTLQNVTITVTSTIKGYLGELTGSTLTAGSNVTMDSTKLDNRSSITLSKPATISISGGVDYISEARLTAPGASKVLFKDFASNAGTVIAEGGTVVFERPMSLPSIGNYPAANIRAKTCTFNECSNQGIVTAAGTVSFNGINAVNGVSRSISIGSVILNTSGASVTFIDGSNLGSVTGRLGFDGAYSTLSTTFRSTGKYGMSSIGNVGGRVENIGKVTFDRGTTNNGNVFAEDAISQGSDLLQIDFKSGSSNTGPARADIINFYGNAFNSGEPFIGTVLNISNKEDIAVVAFHDKSYNAGNVVGFLNFKDNSINTSTGNAWLFTNNLAGGSRIGYFRGNAVNEGYVSTCMPLNSAENLDIVAAGRYPVRETYTCGYIGVGGANPDCAADGNDTVFGFKTNKILLFQDSATNIGVLEGRISFEGGINKGECLGKITFLNESSNENVADGDVKYIDNSTLAAAGTSDGLVQFHGKAKNLGTVSSSKYWGYTVFAGESENSGTVHAPKKCSDLNDIYYTMPTFYDKSKNTEDGKLMSIPNDEYALFFDESENLAELDNVNIWFEGGAINTGKISGDVVFVDGAVNEGEVYGPGSSFNSKKDIRLPWWPYNDASRRKMPVPNAITSGVDNLPEEFPRAGQFFFDGAKNKGTVAGGAIFKGASNQGIVTESRPYFFQSWSTEDSESQAGVHAVESIIEGYVKGPAYFRYSTLKGTAEPNGTAHFKYSNNDGTVIGSALFEQSDNGEEYGGSALVTGNASFIGIGGSYENGDSSGATNYGYVQGDASFSAYAVNFGKVECLNYGDGAGFFGGQVGGNATFTEGSRNGLCGSNYSSLPVNCDGSQGGGLVRTVTWAGVDGNASFDGSSSWGADCSGVGGTTSCPTCNVPDFPDNPPPDNPLIP